ncbi:hypothetical protein, partial [Mycoplasma sp. 1232]|uniref:hypothetical protein n=1 Tax=Mycoplasma sp. 1232 TaxID=3108527 RepID=UPI002B263954
MKKIEFRFSEQNPMKLVLVENASAGDIIDLSSLSNTELFILSSSINNERNDDIRNQVKTEILENLTNLPEYKVNVQGVIDDYNKKITDLKTELEASKRAKQEEIAKLESSFKLAHEIEKQKQADAYNDLKNKLSELNASMNSTIEAEKSKLEVNNIKAIEKVKEEYKIEKQKQADAYNDLKNKL